MVGAYYPLEPEKLIRRRGRGRVVLPAFIALCLLIITVDFRQSRLGPLERARDFATTMVSPLQRGFAVAVRPIDDFFSSIAELRDLRTRNSELEQRLERTIAQSGWSKTLVSENRRLHRSLKLQKSYPTMKVVTAQVLGSTPSNYRWAVQIDKGRSTGIRVDMAVVVPDGLVGKVVQVTDNSSTVLLLIDPGAGAGARIVRPGATGLIAGGGSGDNLSLNLIGNTSRVAVGDLVVTSSYNRGIFPPGIPIGSVEEVGVDSRLLEKKIEVAPAVNFTNLDFVEVLVESGPHGGRAGRRPGGGRSSNGSGS
ncbi:MAG: rod shape-determining protein MreC [Actinomycetota bacterium]|nr:rod shape-determining protein MreC [Actinomycetota bacterium]